jgi:hypothetical protein
VPSEDLDHDLPAYQRSGLAAFLMAKLMARAAARREESARAPRRVRVHVSRRTDEEPKRGTKSQVPADRKPQALPHEPLHPDWPWDEVRGWRHTEHED